MTTTTEYVNAGAAMLDEYDPSWYRSIDTDRLDLSSIHDCILGQLFDGFNAGSVALAELYGPEELLSNMYTSSQFIVEHGFETGPTNDYAEMTRAWLSEIESRMPDGADHEQWETTTPSEVYMTDEDYALRDYL